MKYIQRHFFLLALLLSFLIHFGIVAGDLIPGLVQPNREPIQTVINVRLQPLTLAQQQEVSSLNTLPQERQISTTPPIPSTSSKISLGSGLRYPSHSANPTPKQRNIGMKAPKPITFPSADDFSKLTRAGPTDNEANNQDASASASEESSSPERMAKTTNDNSGTPVHEANSDSPPTSNNTQSQSELAQTTTKKNKRTPEGKRDKQGYIIPESPMQTLPANAKLSYLENRFGLPGVLEWHLHGTNYELSLSVNLPIGKIKYTSTGTINEKTTELQPQHYQEWRKGKVYREAIFNYGDNPTISYGKPDETKTTVPLKPGAQDMLSLTWQLAIKAGHLPGTPQVANGKKVYEYPIQTSQGIAFDVDNGKLRTLPIIAQHDEKKIEAWLAQDFANIPVRIKISDPSLDLQVRIIELNGQEEWVRPLKQQPTRQK